jgi:preprotein translocase subunit SecA
VAEQALAALHRDGRGHYVAVDGKVQIVDEYTGRIADGRSWYPLIEAKEGMGLTGRRETLSRITYQRIFRRYLRLPGMTGTDWELLGELRAAGWPVLIGARSVEASEQLVARLRAVGIPHSVLNAQSDRNEAEFVTRAGERDRITVATNMAGRGADIHLGPGVATLGGLHVIVTEHHDSPRIDRQLIGRGARRGVRCSFEAILSREDELFRQHGTGWLGSAAQLLPHVGVAVLRRMAQWRAETMHAATWRQTLRSDTELRKPLGFAGTAE